MITVAIAINGKTIYARSAVNRLAEVGKYVLDDGTYIEHDPDDGAVALAIKMLETIKDEPDQVIRNNNNNTRRRGEDNT